MADAALPAAGYFVTGTDTGVGKTVVAAWLVQRLNGDYWKPIQAGLDGETDCQTVARLTNITTTGGCLHPPTFSLQAPLSPHEAARLQGLTLLPQDFVMPEHGSRPLIVEGAGGVLVPINREGFLMADLMGILELPVILVSRTALGTINHTLLSLEALRGRGLSVAGVILVGTANPANQEAIRHFGQVRILAEIPWLDPLEPETLHRIPGCHPP